MKDFAELVFNFLQMSHHHANLIYLVFFALAYLDSIAFFGLFIPGTWIVISVGVFVANTSLYVPFCILFLITGAFFSDTTSFFLGKFFSQKLMFLFRRYPSGIEKGKIFFKKYGGISILLARFIGPLRPIIPFVWGMFSPSSFRFCIIDVFSSAISISTLFGLGFLMGRSIFEIKNVDPWILVLFLLLFVLFFMFFKLLWKGLLKLEVLGMVIIQNLDRSLLCLDTIHRKKIGPFFEKKHSCCILSFVTVLMFFVTSLLVFFILYKQAIEVSLLSFYAFLGSLGSGFKWLWITLNLFNQSYTIVVLVFAPALLFYFLTSKIHVFHWCFSIFFVFLVSLFFYHLLNQSFCIVFKSALLVFCLNSLFLIFALEKGVNICVFLFFMLFTIFLSFIDPFCCNVITMTDAVVGSMIGVLSFVLFSLMFIQSLNFSCCSGWFFFNIFILLSVCGLIYLNSFNKKAAGVFEKKIGEVKRTLLLNKEFLIKRHLICFKICGDKSYIVKGLEKNGWKRYYFFKVFFRPLSKEKLIFFINDLRTFFSYSWYGIFPDCSFIRKDKTVRYILKLWKVEDKEFVCFVWSSSEDLTKIRFLLNAELTKEGVLCD